MWNPDVYLAYGDDRARPFVDLMARVGAQDPRRVVDLGCGPGHLTETLSRRWPHAIVEAWDSSAQMVAAARERGVTARLGDVADWDPAPDTDVVVCNAVLHWVPRHPELLERWTRQLPAGAWLAVQVPGNFDAPSHRLSRQVAERPSWSAVLGHGVVAGNDAVLAATGYAELLTDAGYVVDAWETTYVHQLSGPDAVLDWITGTTLRPVRHRLDDAQWARFRAELAPLLDQAYPPRGDGTTFFPFRRVFVVAQAH
ncbi:trans-aconitate 2-methyltransferase [Mycolicibacterium vaccae]|uniref:trans-aconitate 2-methyltransferase n=1 Tax=Mycolicibacterium vaccae TaxID=1810 RepID=UPI003CF9F482